MKVLIVGTGPAGLIAADFLSREGVQVVLVDKKRGPGRKFLIAGSSGLNLTNSLPSVDFIAQYSGSGPSGFWDRILENFSPSDWLNYVHGLGSETFLGTSGRYFVKELKASRLLRAWITRLHAQGCQFHYSMPLNNWEEARSRFSADYVILALGGASYENPSEVSDWVLECERHGIKVNPFCPENVSYEVKWKNDFLKEAEGKPLKNIIFKTEKGSMKGELVITQFGLEGTPVYTLGTPGTALINLKPDLTPEQSLKLCESVPENWAPIRRVQKKMNLSTAAFALLFHHSSESDRSNLKNLINLVHALPIELLTPGPMDRAISSSGGIDFKEIHFDRLELIKAPGVFVCGEMLDWSAPTGGFLIQGSVSLGVYAARSILARPILAKP